MKVLLSSIILLTLVSCGKKDSPLDNSHGTINAQKNTAFFEEIGALTPYTSTGPNAEMLDCVYKDKYEDSCKLSKLSLIGMDTNQVKINDILDRTLVSHKFLGDNFKRLLEESKDNADLFDMFGAVNTIVISDKVTPSFYWAQTGAIYLSAEYFWLSQTQYDILKKKKDPRSAYGRKFKFDIYSSSKIDGESIHRKFRTVPRELADIEKPVVRLLFHELAHANDFFQKSFYRNRLLNKNLSYIDSAIQRMEKDDLISMKLETKPTSEEMLGLAQVAFRGEKETQEQLDYTAEEVADFFDNDLAVAYYSYSSPREDLAMLMESILMMRHFNVDRTTFIYKIEEDETTIEENDYKETLIYRSTNRVLKENIFNRALYGLSQVLPGYNQYLYQEMRTKKLEGSISVEAAPVSAQAL